MMTMKTMMNFEKEYLQTSLHCFFQIFMIKLIHLSITYSNLIVALISMTKY
jgi:hypothetical protein